MSIWELLPKQEHPFLNSREQTFNFFRVENISCSKTWPGTTSVCHWEETKKKKVSEKLQQEKGFVFKQRKRINILLVSNNLPPTTVSVHEELFYKISRFTTRSILYQWRSSCLFDNTRTADPRMPACAYRKWPHHQPLCWDLPHFCAHF